MLKTGLLGLALTIGITGTALAEYSTYGEATQNTFSMERNAYYITYDLAGGEITHTIRTATAVFCYSTIWYSSQSTGIRSLTEW